MILLILSLRQLVDVKSIWMKIKRPGGLYNPWDCRVRHDLDHFHVSVIPRAVCLIGFNERAKGYSQFVNFVSCL